MSASEYLIARYDAVHVFNIPVQVTYTPPPLEGRAGVG